QTFAPEPPCPLVPSVFAPPDMLVYSANQPTSTGGAPSVAPPAVRQFDFRLLLPASVHLRQWTSGEAGRARIVHCSVAGLAGPRPATCSASYRARSATIFYSC